VDKIALDIGRNVQRTVDIVDRLNRFAHSADVLLRVVDVHRVVVDAVALASRRGGLRGRTVRVLEPTEPVGVATYAFGLYQALDCALRLAGLTAQDCAITVSLLRVPQGVVVRVAPVPVEECEPVRELFAQVEQCAAELGGRVMLGADGVCELYVPQRESAGHES
jgi:hypothetical protein